MFEISRTSKSYFNRVARFGSFIVLLTPVIFPQNHPRNYFDTLAVIGNKVISTTEFQKYYKDKLLRVGLTDNGDTRLKYLQNLIDDEVLITDAKKKGLDKSKSALIEYERIYTQELLNLFSEKIIEPSISIPEDDIRNMYLKMNTKIKVRHLYAGSKEEAEKLYTELKSGKTFEELAAVVFHDEKLMKSGGDLGYISVDEMDPNFEDAAFSLNVGEISQPVKTVTGYSIIKVEDRKQNPFVVESEYLKAHDRIKAFVRKRKYEEAAKKFTYRQKEELQIKFNKNLLKEIYSSLQSAKEKNLSEPTSSFYQKNRNAILTTTVAGNWNIKRVVSELRTTPEEQRKWIHSVTDLEDFISGLIIRKNMMRKAIAIGLDTSAMLKDKVDFNFNTYLLRQNENQLRATLIIPKDSIKMYYTQNSDRFMKEAEVRLSSVLVDTKSLADSITILLSGGTSFEKIAKENSIQTVTAKNGGDMGFFRRDDLGNLRDKVSELKPGEWLGPVSDDGKYLFLKCTELKNSGIRNFSEVSGEIEQTLMTLQWNKFRTEYVTSLKKEIHVHVFPEKLHALNLLTRTDHP